MTDEPKKTPKKKGKDEELTDEELRDVAGGRSFSTVDKSAKLGISETLFGGDGGGVEFDTLFAGADGFNTIDAGAPIKSTDQLKR